MKAHADYTANPAAYRRGKIVIGRLIALLQQELGANPKIYLPTAHLKHEDIASVAAAIWADDAGK